MKKHLLTALLLLTLCLLLSACGGGGGVGTTSSEEHTHRYSEWNAPVAATCTEEGVKGYYTCLDCEKLFNETYREITSLTVPALGHDLPAYTKKASATCERYGTKSAVCLVCGYEDFKTDTDALLTHTLVFRDAVPAKSCTSSSLLAHWECSSCRKLFSDEQGKNEIISAEIPPVCLLDLNEDGVCNGCGAKTATEESGWSFYLNDNGTAYRIRAMGHCKDTNVIIPALYNGLPVVEILDAPKTLTSIYIPESVTKIGNGAFSELPSLTSIVIPGSVTYIGDEAFYDCEDLRSVYIFDGATYLGASAFGYCTSLTDVTLPTTVKTIAEELFWVCSSLSRVVIPEGVETLAEHAFGHSRLTYVKLPESLKQIENSVFYECYLKALEIPSGVVSIDRNAFAHCVMLKDIYNRSLVCSDTFLYGSYFDPISIYSELAKRDVHQYASGLLLYFGAEEKVAFGYNGNGGTLELPSGIDRIDTYAFYRAPISYIVIPDSVTAIEDEAFAFSSLCEIVIPDSVTEFGWGVLKSCNSLRSAVIGDGVTRCDNIFEFCFNLLRVTVGRSVTRIDCTWCWRLTEVVNLSEHLSDEELLVTLPAIAVYHDENTTRITTDADGFVLYTHEDICLLIDYIGSANDIVVPDSVNGIGCAFYNKLSLRSVTIGKNVRSIDIFAFDVYDSEIKHTVDIIYRASLTDWLAVETAGCFGENSTLKFNLWLTDADGSTELVRELVIPESVTSIPDSQFAGFSTIESVVFEGSITKIDESAFSGCTGLTALTFLGEVGEICDYAFSGCTALKSVTLPSSATVSSNAFEKNCSIKYQ